jgi:hypothetical protein
MLVPWLAARAYTGTRTRTDTKPTGTEANSAGRSARQQKQIPDELARGAPHEKTPEITEQERSADFAR